MLDPSTLVSVIISNYNYAEFVGEAIESALALDWPRVEVIVVDDGSTDCSRSVIERFGARITALFKENGGQYSAMNLGYAQSQGEIIVFLDSDDYLHPSIGREIASVWRSGVSKVQFQMHVVDAKGRSLGSILPKYDGLPTPQQIRKWMQTTSAHPTPPGSGNAYSREYLQKIFPLDDSCGRAGDSFCIAAAPFLGDVITVPLPLVTYRVHGRNDGAQTGLEPSRFGKEVTRAVRLFEYAQTIAGRVGIDVPDRALFRSLSLVGYRVASLRFAPALHPIPSDGMARILRDLIRGLIWPQGVSPLNKIILGVWTVTVALAPAPLARRAALWRFAPAARPKLLRLGAKRLGAEARPKRGVA
jgi:hypothetical protein